MKKFDKYWYYQQAVQSPEADVEFLFRVYRRIRGKKPKRLREDFCGTFLNLCEWVRLAPDLEGLGIDLDLNPIRYGLEKNFTRLTVDQQRRIDLIKGDVLKVKPKAVDLIAAMNFSYYIFQERQKLLAYFKACYRGLKPNGLLVADCFGGSECQKPNVDRTRRPGFWYFWDQRTFEPITNRAQFSIHFKRDGEKKRKHVFQYDWRMWSIPEIRDIMSEAGFKQTLVYWQDDNEVFRPGKRGEAVESWLAYVIGLK